MNRENKGGGLALLNSERGALMGFAALCIYGFHLWEPLLSGELLVGKAERFLLRIGFYGVDFFFLLSGIGMVYAIAHETTGTFYRRRAQRLVLPYLVSALLSALLEAWSLKKFVYNVFFINFFTASIYCFLWFVPAIALLYLAFPPYERLMKRSGSAGWVTACALGLWLLLSLLGDGVLREDFYGLTNRIPIFMVGVFWGHCLRDGHTHMAGKHWALVALTFALALLGICLTNVWAVKLLLPSSNCGLPSLCTALSAPLLLGRVLSALRTRRAGRVLVRVLSFYGTLSFELYCMQEGLGSWLKARLGLLPVGALPANLLLLALLTAAAWLLSRVNRGFAAQLLRRKTH